MTSTIPVVIFQLDDHSSLTNLGDISRLKNKQNNDKSINQQAQLGPFV